VRKKVDFPSARNQEMRIESFSLQNSDAIRRRVLDLPSEIHHLHKFAEKLDSGAEAPRKRPALSPRWKRCATQQRVFRKL
jgi:hypothetical protein